MIPNIIPTKAEVVAVPRINTPRQQRGYGFRAGEAAYGVSVVATGEIPEQIVAAAIDKRQFFPRQSVQTLCREGFIIV